MYDHLFNFAVTAQALRDWVRKHPKVSMNKSAFDALCNKERVLEACRDIANAHKHFDFKQLRKTKTARQKYSMMRPVFQNGDGKMIVAPAKRQPDIEIIIGNGCSVRLQEFTYDVIEAWRRIFIMFGIHR
jgi:hypothetical protein